MRVWGDEPQDARELAARMGIEHYVADERIPFKETIVKNFIDEYKQGRTPNPCVMCNPLFKFRVLYLYSDICVIRHIIHYRFGGSFCRHFQRHEGNGAKYCREYVNLLHIKYFNLFCPLQRYKKITERQNIITKKSAQRRFLLIFIRQIPSFHRSNACFQTLCVPHRAALSRRHTVPSSDLLSAGVPLHPVPPLQPGVPWSESIF